MYREIKIEDGIKAGDKSGSPAPTLGVREEALARYLSTHRNLNYKALLVQMIDNLSSALAAYDSGEPEEELKQLAMFSLREDAFVAALDERGIEPAMIENKLKNYVECGFFD